MSTSRSVYAAGAFVVLVAACSRQDDEASPTRPVPAAVSAQAIAETESLEPAPVTFDGTVTISARLEGGSKPSIVGVTNLPDGTSLVVTLARKQRSYSAQEKVRVSGSSFTAGPFSQRGAELNPGEYQIRIGSPLTALQPANVQLAFGERGSRLRGPYTGPSPVGGTVVRFFTNVEIGNGENPILDAAEQSQAQLDLRQWRINACGDGCRLVSGVADVRGESFDQNACTQRCLADFHDSQ